MIGLDQESYTVNEPDGSVTICVVFLMNSGIQDSIVTADATISAAGGNATGTETMSDYNNIIHAMISTMMIINTLNVQLLMIMANQYHQVLH